MKNKILSTLLLLALLIPLTSGLVFSQEATDSADTDPQVIKENVKQRIKDIVKGDSIQLEQPVAITGKLLSISNSTLTINSRLGPQMASVSAQTTYARLPGSQSLEFEDIAIEDYLIALGYLNGSQVLHVKRLLAQKTVPQPPTRSTFYGLITNFDPIEDEFTLINPTTKETISFSINRNSDVNVQVDLDQTIPFDPQDEIPQNSYALVSYTPVETNTPAISTMLIKQIDNQSPPVIDSEVHTATPSDQIPPELR